MSVSGSEPKDATRTIARVGYELQVLMISLIAALNRDQSYDEALKAQQVLTHLGEWLYALDEVWREATVDELNAVEEDEP